MPASHRAHVDWTPSRLIKWAGTINAATAEVVEKILQSRPHPEHGYRACLGLMRLARAYGHERLGAACARAPAVKAVSYTSVNSILRQYLDRVPLPGAQLSLPDDPHSPAGFQRSATWGPVQLERFVRALRLPRAELERLDHQLRRAGWTDVELEPLELSRALLGQVPELLLDTARRLRHVHLPPRKGDATRSKCSGASQRPAPLLPQQPAGQATHEQPTSEW